MGKGHARNEDIYLNKGGANEISAQNLVTDLKNYALNIMLNAFRIAQIGSLTIFNMVKGFMDEYEDESGIDLVNSLNISYDSVDDFIFPLAGFDAYTTLLLHGNGLDESVDIIDSTTRHTVTPNGAVKLSTLFKEFGSASIDFPNSTSNSLSITDNLSDFNFGTADFTIDGWFYFKDTTLNYHSLWSAYQDGNNFIDIKYSVSSLGLIWVDFYVSGTYVVDIPFRANPIYSSPNTWHHVALIRTGTTMNLYINGAVQTISGGGSNIIGAVNLDITAPLKLGLASNDTSPLNGYIDEFRVSKGVARWLSDFTPPIEEYLPSLLSNMTLISNPQATVSVPTSVRIVIFEEDVDSITLNTDLIAYISRDNGTTYSQVTLEDEGNYITGARVLSGVVDISGQPSGTNVRYKIETLNTKNLKIHGTGISWK